LKPEFHFNSFIKVEIQIREPVKNLLDSRKIERNPFCNESPILANELMKKEDPIFLDIIEKKKKNEEIKPRIYQKQANLFIFKVLVKIKKICSRKAISGKSGKSLIIIFRLF